MDEAHEGSSSSSTAPDFAVESSLNFDVNEEEEDVRRELESAYEELDQKEQQLAQAAQFGQSLLQAKERLAAENELLTEQCEAREREATQSRERGAQLETQLRAQKAAISREQSLAGLKDDELEELRRRLQSYEKAAQERSSAVEAGEAEAVTELRAEVDEAREREREVSRARDALRARLVELSSDLAESNSAAAAEQEAAARLREELRACEREVARAKERAKELVAALDAAKAAQHEVDEELRAAEARHRDEVELLRSELERELARGAASPSERGGRRRSISLEGGGEAMEAIFDAQPEVEEEDDDDDDDDAEFNLDEMAAEMAEEEEAMAAELEAEAAAAATAPVAAIPIAEAIPIAAAVPFYEGGAVAVAVEIDGEGMSKSSATPATPAAPAAAPAVAAGDAALLRCREKCAAALRAYYGKHNPERLPVIGQIAKQYEGRERTLYERLRRKYGHAPKELLEIANMLSSSKPVPSLPSRPTRGAPRAAVPQARRAISMQGWLWTQEGFSILKRWVRKHYTMKGTYIFESDAPAKTNVGSLGKPHSLSTLKKVELGLKGRGLKTAFAFALEGIKGERAHALPCIALHASCLAPALAHPFSPVLLLLLLTRTHTHTTHTDKPVKWILCADTAQALKGWRSAFERLAQSRRVRQNDPTRRKRSNSKVVALRREILKDIQKGGDVDGDLEYFRRLSLAVRLELMSSHPDFNAPALRNIDATVMYATAKAEGRMFHTWHAWISVTFREHAAGRAGNPDAFASIALGEAAAAAEKETEEKKEKEQKQTSAS